jgi:cyclopropane-fatty-acyl-phospholipid synthase
MGNGIDAMRAIRLRLLRGLLAATGDPRYRMELAGGEAVGAPREEALATLRIRDRGALFRLVIDPELQLGELHTQGRLSLEGDAVSLLEAVFRAKADVGRVRKLLSRRLLERGLGQSLAASARSAQHHYDVGNEFYELWLDERMLYTCAYFPTAPTGLEEAQVAKMDHVCRKLALRPGDRVIEAGCGWGALALHMARSCGARVRAYNVSREQTLYAREQAEKQGLAERVDFIEDDYRNITGRCDAFVSVGMLEHVGLAHYGELGSVIDRCLEPEGRGLIHTIGRSQSQRVNPWIEKRLFPNARPPTLGEMMAIFEPHDFAVLDVENLRLHYAMTAEHWLRRFERNRERVVELIGEERARTWHLYLIGTVATFRVSNMQLFQVVFTRATNDRIPWTRAHLYTDEPSGFAEHAPAWREGHGAL